MHDARDYFKKIRRGSQGENKPKRRELLLIKDLEAVANTIVKLNDKLTPNVTVKIVQTLTGG